jgi:hypothetical protein
MLWAGRPMHRGGCWHGERWAGRMRWEAAHSLDWCGASWCIGLVCTPWAVAVHQPPEQLESVSLVL